MAGDETREAAEGWVMSDLQDDGFYFVCHGKPLENFVEGDMI